jgi:CheY-like chemotaxis protein
MMMCNYRPAWDYTASPCYRFRNLGGHGLKVLVCCESELVRGVAGLALEGAGHDIAAAPSADKLVPLVEGAAALLIEPAQAKSGIMLLRDRGFAGRALLFSEAEIAELEAQVGPLGADGALASTPPDDLAQRFSGALDKRRRVLIVDDSEIAARLLTEELQPKGFEVMHAFDAEAATSIILKRATRPDLILLDINMPKVNGAQFCRFVKKNEMFKAIKVVLCSGQEKEKVAQVAKECGADGFILKDQFLGKWLVEQAG